MGTEEEVPLPGGHMNTVVRVGDTVRRTTGPWRPTVHALRRHIRARGFTLGPEPLGIDERGRERLTGVIDWDVASPGPRAWDLAYAAYRFVPLSSPDNPDIPFPAADEQVRRLARLCAAYGADDVTPRAVLDTTTVRLRDLNAFMHREAAAGNAAQQAIIDRGRGRIYDLDAAYLEAHAHRIAPGHR